MNDFLERRPKLAYPFTILTEPNTVRLVAGEDYRYTLTAPELEHWLPALLARLTGGATTAALVAELPSNRRAAALEIVQHLYGERVLVDGNAAEAHVARKFDLTVTGQGGVYERMISEPERQRGSAEDPRWRSGSETPLVVLCQDRLDYEEALVQHRRARAGKMPFLWVSYGALSRAYVSPLFLPDAGPCFGCLLRSFQRLSPAPEIYDALRVQAREQKPIASVDFPPEGRLVLEGILLWKLREAERDAPDPGLYRLHVLEREHFEVATHRVFADPLCPECKERP